MAPIHVLIPAHNEEAGIGAAITGLLAQDVPCTDICVVCDNCTDATETIAEHYGVRTLVTQGNVAKKAGALNQALRQLLPTLTDRENVLIMDADSVLDPGFIEAAVRYISTTSMLGGVSGTFRGAPGGGYVGMLQRNEYARYARDVRRLKGKALVLTGTAAVFRVDALRMVVRERERGRLPANGYVYDEKVLTEDNELTLALMHMGWKILAPKECTLTTEVMETWTDLSRQRLRWKRGALENIWDYGFTRVTLPYWGRQALSLVSILATVLYLGTLLLAIGLGRFQLHNLWVCITLIFVLERTVSVRDRGWRQQLLAAPLVLEMPFDLWLQVVQGWAFLSVLFRIKATW